MSRLPPCGELEDWIYDCRDINELLGTNNITDEIDIEICEKHYTALQGKKGDKLSKDPVYCTVQNGQCVPSRDKCGLSKAPFEPQTSIFADPNGPQKCSDLPIEACPYFWGTGASANRNCIVDYQRLPSGERIGGVPKICRNADPHTEPIWERPSAMHAALSYKANTCDMKGTWGTTKDCQEICGIEDGKGIGTEIYSYDCDIGEGKYCMCDMRRL
jgi:hypothetical protein